MITSVIEDLQKNGYTYKKAKNMVYGGGLKIYTAIDFDVQKHWKMCTRTISVCRTRLSRVRW